MNRMRTTSHPTIRRRTTGQLPQYDGGRCASAGSASAGDGAPEARAACSERRQKAYGRGASPSGEGPRASMASAAERAKGGCGRREACHGTGRGRFAVSGACASAWGTCRVSSIVFAEAHAGERPRPNVECFRHRREPRVRLAPRRGPPDRFCAAPAWRRRRATLAMPAPGRARAGGEAALAGRSSATRRTWENAPRRSSQRPRPSAPASRCPRRRCGRMRRTRRARPDSPRLTLGAHAGAPGFARTAASDSMRRARGAPPPPRRWPPCPLG